MPRHPRLITANGVTKTLTEWAHDLGLKIPTLFQRLARGWTPEEAIEPNLFDMRGPRDWSTVKDITGRRFGHWIVVARAGNASGGKGQATWRVRCDCGAERIVGGTSLRSGDSTSCGCERNRATVLRCTTHGASAGGSRTPEFRTWSEMKSRCRRPRDKEVLCYSGRGIGVCERWLGPSGFANFLVDMGLRPSPQHSIDRINNDGNYEPGNCRWATPIEQARNTRHNHLVEVNGVCKCLSEWSHDTGIKVGTLIRRLARGWSAARAVGTPLIPPRRDLTGMRVGRLLVLGFATSKNGVVWYHIHCDCGTKKIVRGASLTTRKKPVISCGCSRRGPRSQKSQQVQPIHATDPAPRAVLP